jgi:hypothetical protein
VAQFRVETGSYDPKISNHFEVMMLANNANGDIVTTTNPLPVSLQSLNGQTNIVSFKDTSSDAFGRLRVAEPYTIFESYNRFGVSNTRWNYVNTGNASVSFANTEGCVHMTINTGASDSILYETKKVFPYQPGKSLLIMMSTTFAEPKANLTQRLGFYGANNGVYLEQSNNTPYMVLRSQSTGTVVNTGVPQENWNVDKFNGNGPSGLTLNLTKSQIFWTDIEWLGVGSVRTGFIINGQFYLAHVFHHANISTSTYMTTACLPLRYEIFNTGVTTSQSLMRKICSTILSEGGYNQVTLSRSISNPIAGKNLSNGVKNPMVSIRLRSGRLDAVVIPFMVDFYGLQATAFKYYIMRNVTSLTSASFQITDSSSSVEYDLSATALTGGEVVFEGIFKGQQVAQSIDLTERFNHTLQLSRTINQANGDIFTIAVEPTTNNDDAIVALSWQEHTI